ncbi:MAG: tetratricopeptide repeat protein [Paludibacteraceae bacterium]|nr:tetratricopeptide repeat protein [Paludibacteraceae bacterium]MBR5972843.1 tetratricopeptide repeat protein [Paludibacteraceae bacterium]
MELSVLKNRLTEGVSETLIQDFKEYISAHPESDEAYFLLGNAYRRQENWEFALNAYQQAMDLNAESPARMAYDAIQEVLAFYNKDMYNQ